MAIKSVNGNTMETLDDVQQLSPEALERFKKEHNGMTPEEYSHYYTKMTLTYSFRKEVSILVERIMNSKSSLEQEVAACENKTSTLSSAVRGFITFLNGTDEGKVFLREIVDEQIQNFKDFAAKRKERIEKAEEQKKKQEEADEKARAEKREKKQAYLQARREAKEKERAERKAAQLAKIAEKKAKRAAAAAE
jgi:hypothetical protein